MWQLRYNKNGTKRASFQNVIVILIFFITLAQNNEHIGRGFCVRAFSPSSTTRISKMKSASSAVVSDPSHTFIPATSLLMSPGKSNNQKNKNEDEEISSVLWKDLDKKPANLIILPIVALFGVDLLLNIAVITKRSIEYFFLGQAPSTETWW